jgi:hypothetical protein
LDIRSYIPIPYLNHGQDIYGKHNMFGVLCV